MSQANVKVGSLSKDNCGANIQFVDWCDEEDKEEEVEIVEAAHSQWREHKPAKDPEYLIAQLEGEHKLALSLHQMMCTMEDDVLNFKTNVMIVSQGLKGAERNIEEALEQFAMAERSLEALELQMINLEQE